MAAGTKADGSATNSGLRAVLWPRSVAVVGASRRPNTVGGALLANLLRDGFAGPVYPVNPNATEINGLRAYPTVTAIGQPVDLAIIVVPVRLSEQAVADCIAAGVRGLVIITSGFAEASAEGRALERRITAMVRAAGIRLVGPNCMGVVNTDAAVRLNATFTPVSPPPGNIGMLSQSGALGLAMLSAMRDRNLGISTFVSVGNKADVSGNDLLEYWRDDPGTDVIALYLESFGNPRKFGRVAPDVVRRKPIVAVKSGRSAAGSRAASSHSAALASLDVAVDALFEQAGVIRTNTIEELYDVAALLATQPLPPGPRVGVVTNAGGPGILLADACETRGLTLPTPSPETLAVLRGFLPPHAGLANPIDMAGSDSPQDYRRAIEAVGNDAAVDSVVVVFIPPLLTTQPDAVAAAIAEAAGRIPPHKPVLTVFLSYKGVPPLLCAGPRGRIPSFSYPEDAAMSLAAAHRHALWRVRPLGKRLTLEPAQVAAIRAIVDRRLAAAEGPVWLSTPELTEVLGAAGIPFAPSAEVAPGEVVAAAERLGYPLVAKAVAPGLVHKSDIGGVILGIDSPDAAWRAVLTLQQRIASVGRRLEAVVLQCEVSGGIEALVGVTTDPTFGPLVVCGLGGVLVELLRDASFRLTPVSDVDAAEMIGRLRCAALLDGYRGSPPGERQALIDVILRVSALVEVVPEIVELDLNPVKVLPPGRGTMTVDARLRLAPVGWRAP